MADLCNLWEAAAAIFAIALAGFAALVVLETLRKQHDRESEQDKALSRDGGRWPAETLTADELIARRDADDEARNGFRHQVTHEPPNGGDAP
jgi:hypothetical protein